MKEYTIYWNIENYSCCWHKNEEVLATPEFTAEGLEGTVWYLELFPRGCSTEDENNISLFLTRSNVDNGPVEFFIHYELSILTEDGSTLCTEKDAYSFKNRNGRGNSAFVEIDEVLDTKKHEYLPQDTLKVRCKMWCGEGSIQMIGQNSIRTRITVTKISFFHTVDFDALELKQINTFEILLPSKNVNLSCRLYISDGYCCEEKIMFEIKSSSIKFISKCKLFLMDELRNFIDCGPVNNSPGVVENDIVKFCFVLTKEELMDRKNEILARNALSLKCELTFSTGVEYSFIEEIVCEMPAFACNTKGNAVAVQKQFESSNALDDFKYLYTNRFLTDIELKTNTASYHAHKIVLCARSLVLKAMLSNDMKEKICDCIKIEDLDDNILKQLLLFFYCDEVENLQWETAMKLYYAADKYEVKKLKLICSQYLQDNVTADTAPELLLLADTHSDPDLKQLVEHFVIQNDVLVFDSSGWGNLMETNPQLAVKTMHLKYKKKN